MPPPPTRPPLPRDQFPASERLVYLDSAYASPLPVVAAEAVAADARDASRRGALALDDRLARRAPLRARAAALLGTDTDDVALVANTTHGLGLVAAGLDWREGDRVLVPADDHPTTILPWEAQAHRGATVERVAAGSGSVAEALTAALDGRTDVRVVTLSWVQAHDGERTDLAALAEVVHAHGAVLCVDLIQGAGVLPVDLAAWGVDAAAAGSQKWLLGPHGIGALAVTPSLRQRLALVTASKGSLAAGETAARLESGAPNHAGVAAWGAALGLLADAGADAVWAWVDHLATRLADGCAAAGLDVVSPRSDGARSALVTVVVPGQPADRVVARLAAADVVASARGPGVRFSPAGWNDEADVDAALAALVAL
ncbi:aminotransferase class V-fold PLP-dependent enzyme [Iamia sp. SCSIO 61187]|uniref:aminotransferase class V-fold PLP-dependent enzyme n=1 Tax=Iamia sp. SCSIO 61187 TaxID=2722752 RepID=UPI001C630C2B|nr:aminotransferase class V-fold PLP-dependent enzyme [Iamia sp. SCSIO 61187]QYG92309.1 aminotransferase class V-fold PLP-dependent enzyme [Iamia sp. SCSIO 61187]